MLHLSVQVVPRVTAYIGGLAAPHDLARRIATLLRLQSSRIVGDFCPLPIDSGPRAAIVHEVRPMPDVHCEGVVDRMSGQFGFRPQFGQWSSFGPNFANWNLDARRSRATTSSPYSPLRQEF